MRGVSVSVLVFSVVSFTVYVVLQGVVGDQVGATRVGGAESFAQRYLFGQRLVCFGISVFVACLGFAFPSGAS